MGAREVANNESTIETCPLSTLRAGLRLQDAYRIAAWVQDLTGHLGVMGTIRPAKAGHPCTQKEEPIV